MFVVSMYNLFAT